MDRDYKQWLTRPSRKKSIKTCGDVVTKNVVDSQFWKRISQVTSVCEPIVCLLRLVDGCIPCVGKIYWKMYKLEQDILTSAILDQAQKTTMSCMINRCWKMLHTDLHSAGFVLDPEYREFLQHENEEVISGFHAMIDRIHACNVAAQVRANTAAQCVPFWPRSICLTCCCGCQQGDVSKPMVAGLWCSRARVAKGGLSCTVSSGIGIGM